MSDNITYRHAAQNDVKAVTELLCALYETPWDELLIENKRYLTDGSMIFVLAFDGAKAVGIAHGSLRCEYVNGTNDEKKGYLEAVYVLPEYRMRGIAAGLVNKTERWAARHGCREFASDCQGHNTDSYQFHLKIGFKETERCIFFLKEIKPLTYHIHTIDPALRERIQPILNESWGAPELAVNGKLWDSRTMPGITAVGGDGEIYGYLLYVYHDGAHRRIMEIMLLESVVQQIGVASALINEAKRIAKSSGIGTIIVQTSNDNTHAFRFYQRRGFTIRGIRLGALDMARRLKPVIPLIGENGIPLRDEIEFELNLTD